MKKSWKLLQKNQLQLLRKRAVHQGQNKPKPPAAKPKPKPKAKVKKQPEYEEYESEEEEPPPPRRRASQPAEVDRHQLAAEVLGLLQQQRYNQTTARRSHYASWFANM